MGRSSDPIVAAMLARILDPRGWTSATNEVDEALQRMAEGPRLADLWNVERQFAEVFNAWIRLRQRSFEHNKVMLDAWTRAAGAFAKRLNARIENGEPPLDSMRAFLTLWGETANEILLETQRTDAFLETQREVLKASTDLRLAQRTVAEFYSEMYGYPTRAELDDVHKSVTELRRELRAFKRSTPRTTPLSQAQEKPEQRHRDSAPRPPGRPRLHRNAKGHAHEQVDGPVDIRPEQVAAEVAALGEKIARARSSSRTCATRTWRSPPRRRTRSGGRTK